MLENSLLRERFERLLDWRRRNGALRDLVASAGLVELSVDFASNDYLGMARQAQRASAGAAVGSTGSRLLTGGRRYYLELEERIAAFHAAPAALMFNSGYDANVGWAQAALRANDVVLADAQIHASVHDGLRLAGIAAEFFAHNDVGDLELKLQTASERAQLVAGANVFVLVESVYSMSGQICPLRRIVELCEQYGALLMVDEAHGTGVLGARGEGLVQALGLEGRVWLRLHTFGKALGAHGAVLLGSELMKSYMVNYARSLIYTTALPPHAVQAIASGYDFLQSPQGAATIERLQERIQFFCEKAQAAQLPAQPQSPIQGLFCTEGNVQAKRWAAFFQKQGIDLRPILSPTVERGGERLRVCLHAYNTEEEINKLFDLRAEIANARI